jgi:beta-RFAP synthase
MTRVVAPSRLHFGLLNLAPPEPTARQFGGVGLMVEAPEVIVRVEAADAWSAAGPSADRAAVFARRAAAVGGTERPLRVTVERCPPQHVGLGVGTQLGLATALAVAHELGRPVPKTAGLALWAGRGERSGVGAHGFVRGGLIVEGGKREADPASVLVGRYEFPADWRVVLARPRTIASPWAGRRERQAFSRPRPIDLVRPLTERMCRVLVLGLLPGLIEEDWEAFGESVHEYNRLAGRMFAEDQGGDYATPEVEQVVTEVRRLGVPGAGQSSWGPTVFAVCPDPERAARLEAELAGRFTDLDVMTTTANTTGATVL